MDTLLELATAETKGKKPLPKPQAFLLQRGNKKGAERGRNERLRGRQQSIGFQRSAERQINLVETIEEVNLEQGGRELILGRAKIRVQLPGGLEKRVRKGDLNNKHQEE